MKICVAGEGACGQKHLDALKRIPDAEITCLAGNALRDDLTGGFSLACRA